MGSGCTGKIARGGAYGCVHEAAVVAPKLCGCTVGVLVEKLSRSERRSASRAATARGSTGGGSSDAYGRVIGHSMREFGFTPVLSIQAVSSFSPGGMTK